MPTQRTQFLFSKQASSGRKVALLADKSRPRRNGCAVLAGKATLNRLENGRSAAAPRRYHKITADTEALANLLVDRFMDRPGKPPSRIVLDIDPTDVEMHGAQEGRRWHGYYGHHCCLPLYVVCGRHTLGVALRAGNAGPLEGAVAELERIVSRIRARWPGTEFVVRADAGYAKDPLMSWCEARGVHYVFGLPKNKRLVEAIGWDLADAEAECEAKGRPARRYVDGSPRPPWQPTSCGSSSPRWQGRSSSSCAKRCTTRGSPAPRPPRCGRSCSRSVRGC